MLDNESKTSFTTLIVLIVPQNLFKKEINSHARNKSLIRYSRKTAYFYEDKLNCVKGMTKVGRES